MRVNTSNNNLRVFDERKMHRFMCKAGKVCLKLIMFNVSAFGGFCGFSSERGRSPGSFSSSSASIMPALWLRVAEHEGHTIRQQVQGSVHPFRDLYEHFHVNRITFFGESFGLVSYSYILRRLYRCINIPNYSLLYYVIVELEEIEIFCSHL